MVNEDRLLTSDSLVDRLPNLEQKHNEEDSFFVCTLAVEANGSVELLSGRSVGVSFEDDVIKTDVRLDLQSGFDLIKLHMTGDLRFRSVYLVLEEDVVERNGPFEVIGLRTCDVDSKTKTCTVGIDLKTKRAK